MALLIIVETDIHTESGVIPQLEAVAGPVYCAGQCYGHHSKTYTQYWRVHDTPLARQFCAEHGLNFGPDCDVVSTTHRNDGRDPKHGRVSKAGTMADTCCY